VPDVPAPAIQAAAEVLFRQYESEYSASHLTWRDFADQAREVLEAAMPAIERASRRKVAREILALDAADKAIERSPATNKGPFGDVRSSVRRLARGEPLPRPEDLRGDKARA
jgi:hypothetical protein